MRQGKRKRARRRGPGRPLSKKVVRFTPIIKHFTPSIPMNSGFVPKTVFLYNDELEALRLIDHEGLDQEEAGKRMQISRGTVWRLLKKARLKLASVVIGGNELHIVSKEEEGSA